MKTQSGIFFSTSFSNSHQNHTTVDEIQKELLTGYKKRHFFSDKLPKNVRHINLSTTSTIYDRKQVYQQFNDRFQLLKQRRQRKSLELKESLQKVRKNCISWHHNSTPNSSRNSFRLPDQSARQNQNSLRREIKKKQVHKNQSQLKDSNINSKFTIFVKQNTQNSANKLSFYQIKKLKRIFDTISKNENKSVQRIRSQLSQFQKDQDKLNLYLKNYNILAKKNSQVTNSHPSDQKLVRIPKKQRMNPNMVQDIAENLPQISSRKKSKRRTKRLKTFYSSGNFQKKGLSFIQIFLKEMELGGKIKESDVEKFKKMNLKQLQQNCHYLKKNIKKLEQKILSIISEGLIINTINNIKAQKPMPLIQMNKFQILEETLSQISCRIKQPAVYRQSKFSKIIRKISEQIQDEQQDIFQNINEQIQYKNSEKLCEQGKQNEKQALKIWNKNRKSLLQIKDKKYCNNIQENSSQKIKNIQIKTIKDIQNDQQQKSQSKNWQKSLHQIKKSTHQIKTGIFSTKFFNIQTQLNQETFFQDQKLQHIEQIKMPLKIKTVTNMRRTLFRRMTHLPFTFGRLIQEWQNKNISEQGNILNSFNLRDLTRHLDDMAQQFTQQKIKMGQIEKELARDDLLRKFIVRQVDSLFTMRRKLKALKHVTQAQKIEFDSYQNKNILEYIQLVQKTTFMKNRMWAQQRLRHMFGQDIVCAMKMQSMQGNKNISSQQDIKQLLARLKRKELCCYRIIQTSFQEPEWDDRIYHLRGLKCQNLRKQDKKQKFLINFKQIGMLSQPKKDDCLVQIQMSNRSVQYTLNMI